jgi:hypothetical protein
MRPEAHNESAAAAAGSVAARIGQTTYETGLATDLSKFMK